MFKITGTIIVHDLDDLVFGYAVKEGQFLLPGEVNLSDRTHEIAAHIIAREIQRLVTWQDMVGNKQFAYPDSEISEENVPSKRKSATESGLYLFNRLSAVI